jgi:ribokinase
MSVRVLCVGGLTLDWHLAGRTRRGPHPGGNALYAAVGASIAGATPSIVARVGDDYPSQLLHEIESRGLAVDGIVPVPGRSYQVLLEQRDGRREVRYLADSGKNDTLDAEPQDLGTLPYDGVHVCPARGPNQQAIVQHARPRARLTTLDVLFVAGELQPTPEEILTLAPLVDVFLPSWSEVCRLWPGTDARTTLRRLTDAGFACVVVKMGSRGALAGDGRRTLLMPSLAGRVVDTTGAGDAFCGAFHAAWLESGDLRNALAWGAAAASVAVEDYGALHAMRREARVNAADRYATGLKECRAIT